MDWVSTLLRERTQIKHLLPSSLFLGKKIKASMTYSTLIITLFSAKANRNISSVFWPPTTSYSQVLLLTYRTLHFLEQPVLPIGARHRNYCLHKQVSSKPPLCFNGCPCTCSNKRISKEQKHAWCWLLGREEIKAVLHAQTPACRFIYYSIAQQMHKRSGIKAWYIHQNKKNITATKVWGITLSSLTMW